MVNDLDIIHMKGRIYDPTLGRFLQADPFIQAPKNSQNYNRYSYVLNNPMSYTDPSGDFFGALFNPGKKLLRSVFKALGSDVSNIIIGAVSIMCGPAAPACAGYLSYNNARAHGASSTGALRAGITAAAAAYVFSEIGQKYQGYSAQNINDVAWNGANIGDYVDFGGNLLTPSQVAGQIANHAIAGGVISTLSGGKFGHGFFSAGVTKGVGGAYLPGGSDLSGGEIARGTVVSAVIGGTASVISGGKFANGARTATFQYLFNQASKVLGKSKVAILRFKALYSAVELKNEFNDIVNRIGKMSYEELKKYFPKIMKIGLSVDASRNYAQIYFYNKFYNIIQQQVAMTGVKLIQEMYINIASDRSLIPMIGILNRHWGPKMTIEYSTQDIRSYLNEKH